MLIGKFVRRFQAYVNKCGISFFTMTEYNAAHCKWMMRYETINGGTSVEHELYVLTPCYWRLCTWIYTLHNAYFSPWIYSSKSKQSGFSISKYHIFSPLYIWRCGAQCLHIISNLIQKFSFQIFRDRIKIEYINRMEDE